ncbi:hypothetical protein Cgig2_019932 [Carnegiea gigantea]|uniref:Uncharacterized protein n=1 Tax=Carnegiea gigantea TaxID=171969 RepID=A0A9Q1QJQ6_9CARY|nr:hypothetical protein Cgig2_019932 [Carnegiea gigantea]
MAFPRPLSTKEMVEYVVRHFEWDQRGVVFPSSPLPKDFQALCPTYELVVAKEAVEHFELPELPRKRTRRWNRNSRARPLRGRPPLLTMTNKEMMFRHPTFRKEWYNGRGKKTKNARYTLSHFIMAFPPLYDTREIIDYVRESFIWHWRRATRPSRPLLEDYHVLCPRFSLPKAKRAATDFELPEMVHATFHAMLLNGAVELSVVHGFMAAGLKSSLGV